MLKKIYTAIIDALYPQHIRCMICGNELDSDSPLEVCAECRQSLPVISTYCVRCGAFLPPYYEGLCPNCMRHKYTFTQTRAAFAYTGNIRKTIYRYKYMHDSTLAQPLSQYIIDKYISTNWKIDIVIPIPLHPNREKSRGYNQSTLLAQHFGNATGIPLTQALIRVKDTPSQTELTHAERIDNLEDAFKLTDRDVIKGKNILIIDDVYTTGATIQSATEILMYYGANKVYALTVAHAIEPELKDIIRQQNNPNNAKKIKK